MIDNIEFNDIIKNYKYVEVPKMFLLKIHHIYQFKYEIGIKKFNDFILNSNDTEKTDLEFKYPKKVQNKEMIKCSNDDFTINLMKYVNNLHNKDLTMDIDIEINTLSKTNKLSDNKNNLIKKKFCIPVLWNGCECIKNMLVHQNTKLNKKIIISHYLNCVDCEINDNNNKIINFENNKKIVIKNINKEMDFDIFDSLVDSYKKIESFNIEYNDNDNGDVDNDVDNNLKIEKDKLNIIMCSKSSSIYSQCLFLVE